MCIRDRILRREAIAFSLVESFLDSSLNAHEAGAELIFGEFADTADTTVAQVVDVVDAVDHAGAGHAVGNKELDGVLTVAQGNEDGHRVDDVFAGKRHGTRSACLLYTSDAADEEDSVDLGGRRNTKKKITTMSYLRWHRLSIIIHMPV